MTAEAIAKALGGRKAGSGWTARCPAHDDRTPSLSIRDADDNKVLVRCHAGCDQERVIAALRTRGLWAEKRPHSLSHTARRTSVERKPDHDDARRSEAALAIWQSSRAGTGNAGRDLSRLARHRSAAARRAALSCRPEASFGRYLAGDGGAGDKGRGRNAARDPPHFPCPRRRGKAPIDPQKMMLGPCRGGAVRLAEPSDVLMVGEGIETCLAAMQATGHPAWAALSTSGLRVPRSAEQRARRHRPRRWRRRRRGGSA